MNNQGFDNHNYHNGDTIIQGDLNIKENLTIDGNIDITGDLVIDAGDCLKTDCIKATTNNGTISVKNTDGFTIANFNDDQTIYTPQIVGLSSGIILRSNASNSVLLMDDGAGVTTAGARFPNTKINCNEIQSDTFETGQNPRLVFSSTKAEIKGNAQGDIDFETKNILTSDIKKDASGGNLVFKVANGTQIMRTDNNFEELYIGEDADGYRMPKLRGTIGQVLTQSNTGVSTFEDLPQTGSNTVIGVIVAPRTSYITGTFQNVGLSFSGSTSIAANTWNIGDVLTVKIVGEYQCQTGAIETAFFRLDVGQSLLNAVSTNVYPTAIDIANVFNMFQINVCLTRTGTNTINWIANGIYEDSGNGAAIRRIEFGGGELIGYNEILALPIDILFQDNSAGSNRLKYYAQSGIWTQATPSAVVQAITTTDHTALTNLELGDSGHSQFPLSSGRSGGQSLDGGILAGDKLTLRSNAITPEIDEIDILSNIDIVNANPYIKLTDTNNTVLGDGTSYVSFQGVGGLSALLIDESTRFGLISYTANKPIELIANNNIMRLDASGNLLLPNNLTLPGSIDTSDSGILAIAPVDASKVEIGSSSILTQIKGDTILRGSITGKDSCLTINNDNAADCHVLLNGTPIVGAASSEGLCFQMETNLTNDRRLIIKDTALAVNNTNSMFRLINLGTRTSIGAIATDRITIRPLYIGSDLLPLNTNSNDLGSDTYKWRNLILSGNIVVNGSIDSSDSGIIAIGASDASKLELGSVGITTEVQGNLTGLSTSVMSGMDTGTAWAYYVHDNVTPGGPYPVTLTVGTPTFQLADNGNGAGGFNNQLPRSGFEFWNTTTNLIEPEFENDTYMLELRINASNPTTPSGGVFDLHIEIGSGGGIINIPLGTFVFGKGVGNTDFSKTTLIFCANTFKLTGGKIIISRVTGDTTVNSFSLLICRLHKAR